MTLPLSSLAVTGDKFGYSSHTHALYRWQGCLDSNVQGIRCLLLQKISNTALS